MEKPFEIEVAASRSYLSERKQDFIAGPFPDVRWPQLQDVAELVANTVAAAFEISRSDINDSIGYIETDDHVAPSVRFSVPVLDIVDPQQVAIVIEQVLQLVTRQSSLQAPLFDTNFLNDHQEIVYKNANNFLGRRGGERIVAPISVRASAQEVARIQGTFAPRPPDVLDDDEPQSHVATVDMLHAVKREGVATTANSRQKLVFRFSDEYRNPLGMLLINRQTGTIELQEGLDAQGRKVLSVCGVADFDDESAADFSLA